MWAAEWIASVYFVFLAAASWVRRLPFARRAFITITAAATCFAIRRFADVPVLRVWAPCFYILIGYYLSGLLFVAPTPAFERWLIDWDRRILGDPSRRFARWPRFVVAYLELMYVGTFLVVPAGLVALLQTRHDAHIDRYWTMVLGAEFVSFGAIALVQSRPPWAIERDPSLPDRSLHGFAAQFVEQFTIRANTFPSGHVASSLAVALAVGSVAPLPGIALLIAAISIAVATVVGRYHYIADGIAGALLAIVLWAATRSW